jgi:multiple sugar transport system permease protein
LVALIGMLFPTAWMILTAFKERSAVASANIWDLGEHFPTLNNFVEVFTRWGFETKLQSSIIVALSTTLLGTLVGAPAAFIFTRFRFRQSQNVKFFILSFRFLPPIAVIVPFYYIYSKLGLLDTYQVLIITYMLFTVPFVIWMLASFFEEVPKDLDEAAQVDGCSMLQALMKVVLPAARNGLLVTMFFSFIFAWNEFIFAMLLTRERAQTVPVGTAAFIGAWGMPIEWGLVSAATLIYVVPMFIAVIVLHKHIVRGLTFGAVKA